MKIVSIFVSFFLCCVTLCAEPLVIGTTSGYAPYVSLNTQGEYEGFDIDFARLLAEKLNRELEIKDLGSMPSLLIGLKQKKVDALIWAVSITEERLKQIDMVYYQGEKITTMPLLFWGQIPDAIKSPQEFIGDAKKIICVESGSYQEQVMQSYPGLALKNVDKITDALLEIKFKKSLAVAIDNSLVASVQQKNPEVQALYFPLPEGKQSLGNGICINKENKELTAQIQKAVEELTVEGKISELEKKWNLNG